MTDPSPDPPASVLRFEFDEASQRLTAHFEPGSAGSRVPDRTSLLAALDEAGWSALLRDDIAVARFLQLAALATKPIAVDIAERRNGHCTIRVSDDAMSATLELSPAFGGRAVDREQVDAALREAGISSGILDDAIEQALAAQSAEALPIARGRPAQSGRPARFISLLPSSERHGPRVDERGIADYRELGTLVIVHAGDRVMQRVPANPGVAGEDIHGLVIPAAQVDDAGFATGLSGTSPSAEDPDVLVADIAGQPVLAARGVSVLPTITVPGVDLTSGNIEFDGTVKVTGDIAQGMHVRATGDVFVAGVVEAARIEAGGDIHVGAGAIGTADTHRAHAHGGDHRARLVAEGSVSVAFCENAVIRAGGDIRIGDGALHSDLTADGEIVIGKPGGRRSQLIGGIARAASALHVGVLGSTAGVHTHVEIGYQPDAYAQLAALRVEIERSEAKLDSLHQVLAYTEALTDAHHRDLHERAGLTLQAGEATHVELLERRDELQASLVLSEDPRIVVGQAVHAGIDIRLGNHTLRTSDSSPGGTFRIVDDEIVFDGAGASKP